MRNDRYRDGLSEDDRRRVAGCAFSAAVVTAPFIALLYSQTTGLAVLALALGCTAYFAFDAYRLSTGSQRRRFLILTLINAAFLVVAAIVLLWLLIR